MATTLIGVVLLGLIFNVLNFENGLGWIILSACWQSVVRGVFSMVVVVAGSGAARRAVGAARPVAQRALGGCRRGGVTRPRVDAALSLFP